MSFELNARLKRTEGALLRMMGLLGRRGFEVVRLNVRPSEDGAAYEVTALLTGDRPSDVLVRQVRRLFDVDSAEVREPSVRHQTA